MIPSLQGDLSKLQVGENSMPSGVESADSRSSPLDSNDSPPTGGASMPEELGTGVRFRGWASVIDVSKAERSNVVRRTSTGPTASTRTDPGGQGGNGGRPPLRFHMKTVSVPLQLPKRQASVSPTASPSPSTTGLPSTLPRWRIEDDESFSPTQPRTLSFQLPRLTRTPSRAAREAEEAAVARALRPCFKGSRRQSMEAAAGAGFFDAVATQEPPYPLEEENGLPLRSCCSDCERSASLPTPDVMYEPPWSPGARRKHDMGPASKIAFEGLKLVEERIDKSEKDKDMGEARHGQGSAQGGDAGKATVRREGAVDPGCI